MHAALFSPTKTTLLKAIENGNFIGWPGLNVKDVKKHMDETSHTAKGHLNQHRQNLQSTQKYIQDQTDFFPPQEPTITNECMVTILDNQQKEKQHEIL